MNAILFVWPALIVILLISVMSIDRRYPRQVVSPCAAMHTLTVIDAQPAKCESPHTIALYRCDACNLHYTNLLPGTWTIETLLLSESKTAKEQAELERAYGK